MFCKAITGPVAFQHTDLGQYLEKHPGGLNPRNVKVGNLHLILSAIASRLFFILGHHMCPNDYIEQSLLRASPGR